MIQFAEVFPAEEIVVSLVRHLSWTHFIALIPLKQPLQRDFYAEMCRVERWSVRILRQKISSMLYERTALSRKPDELAKLELQTLRDEDRMTPDLVLRDPYLTDRDASAMRTECDSGYAEYGDGADRCADQEGGEID